MSLPNRFFKTTTNKFNLVLSNATQSNGEKTFWVDKFDEIMKLERRFHSFDVTFDEQNYHKNLMMFTQITLQSAPIRKLVLRKINFEHQNDFLAIFRRMPHLEDLELSKVYFKSLVDGTEVPAKKIKLAEDEVYPIDLRKLRSLIVDDCEWIIFSFLTATETRSLKMSYSVKKHPLELLINFLTWSNQLKSIKLGFSTYFELFSKKFPKKVGFKLTKWSTFDESFHIIPDHLVDFLTPHLSSLEDLQINCPKEELLLLILEKCQNLKKLRIYADVPSSLEFYEDLKPIVGINQLTCRGRIESVKSAKAFLSLFPNLEKLNLDTRNEKDLISRLLPFISRINPNLKSLTVDTLTKVADMKFNSLEFFNVKDLEDQEVLIALLKKNLSIETLRLGCVGKNLLNFLGRVMDETNVKHLQLTGVLKTMLAVFNKITVNYKKLKSLQLNIYIGKDDDIRVRMFEFPEDPSKWNPQSYKDFADIVPLPYVQWDHYQWEEENVLADLGDMGYLLAVNQLVDIEHEFIVDGQNFNNDVNQEEQ